MIKYIRRKDKNVKSIETQFSPITEVSQKSDDIDQFLQSQRQEDVELHSAKNKNKEEMKN